MIAYITSTTGSSYQVKRDTEDQLNEFIEYQRSKVVCPWGEDFLVHIQVDHAQILSNIVSILSSTDWLMIPDVPISDEHRDCYKRYRSHLRDCHNSNTNPMSFTDYVDLDDSDIEDKDKLISKLTVNV